jgi:hypothetical protein
MIERFDSTSLTHIAGSSALPVMVTCGVSNFAWIVFSAFKEMFDNKDILRTSFVSLNSFI